MVHRLSHDGIKVNVTAIFVLDQVRNVAQAIEGSAELCIRICWPHCRCGYRLYADDARICRAACLESRS